MRQITLAAFATVLLPALLGCGAEADVAGDSEDQVYPVTRIGFQADGSVVTERWNVTRAEQIREHAEEQDTEYPGTSLGEAEQAISSRESGCLTTDFRMWEDDNYTGSQLCFYGTQGIANLANYDYPNGLFNIPWTDAVRSIKPGGNAGEFAETEFSFSCCGSICRQTADDNDTATCVDTANWFSFKDYCNIPC